MHAPVESPTAGTLEKGFRLDTLRIDPGSGEVSGPGGVEKLDPKVMGVLVMLAQNAGQVVLRTDLLDHLWPGVIVTDEALSRCIYELRRHLGQAAGDEQFKEAIETLPKRGYRLKGQVAPLIAVATGSRTAPRRRGAAWIVVGLAAAIVAVIAWRGTRPPPSAPIPRDAAGYSIAVLPFVDLSENRDQAYFSDGTSEEILNHLAQSSELRVIARTSSFSFRDRPLDIQEIARRLGVTHVLEGSVRKSGDRVRVTAQLIAASNGSHLWSETFDRTLDDVFAIQDEIATGVAAALKATLRPDRRSQETPTNLAAYENLLQGEHFYYRRGPGDDRRAVAHLQRAVELDPGYARAWAVLSAAYSLQAWETDPPSKELMDRQRDAAIRAVELDPNLAIAHSRLAHYYGETGDSENSRKHHELSIELAAPGDALSLAHRASLLDDAGDSDGAIEIQKLAVARDPLNSVYRQVLNVSLMEAGRLEEALSSYETMRELNPNLDPDWAIEIPRILALLGRYEEAVPAALELPPGKYRDQAMSLMARAPGYRDQAAAALARLEAYVPSPPLDGPRHRIMDAVRLAETYAFLGRKDEAFSTLTKKLDELTHLSESHMYTWYLHLESNLSPILKPLHADPRWAAFMSQQQ